MKFEAGDYWLEPLARKWLTLNGIPLNQPTRVTCGDVLGHFGGAFRLWVAGQPLVTSAVTEAEVFAADVQGGLLEVDDGKVRLRWRREASALADFGRTSLARSAASLELVVCRTEGIDARGVLELVSALGPLAEKTTFILPAPVDGLPRAVGVRVAPPVDVRFDGELVALAAPVWLAAGPRGLQLEEVFSPAPSLFVLEGAAFLSCVEGWGALEWIGRPNAAAVVAPGPSTGSQLARHRFQLPLLAGDDWLLHGGGATHQLTVRPASAAQPAPRRPRAPESFVFEGEGYRSVTFMFEAGDVVYTQGADGLFRGPGPAVFGISGPGELRWLRDDARVFTFYERSELPHPCLALPSSSAFLRGRTPFPDGLFSPERAEVFIDQLLEQQDGAALALSRLVRGELSERPHWFAKLLVSQTHRHKLAPWLAQVRDLLSRFVPELELTDPKFAGAVLHAVATEPLLGYVREVKIDVEDTRWFDFMRLIRAIPNVRVIGCRHGEEIARFEPGTGVQLDAPTARFYERHL